MRNAGSASRGCATGASTRLLRAWESVVVAALADPVVLVAIVAGLAKRDLLTAHTHKSDKPPTWEP
jgi:hypothetical protein